MTDHTDKSVPSVCIETTNDFLLWMKSSQNVDLILPNEKYNFKGLKTGERWCLCLQSFLEAKKHHKAPPVIPEASS